MQEMQWFRRYFGQEDCTSFINHFERMWRDAGKPAGMVLVSDNFRGMEVTLFARLPIDLDDWERIGAQHVPREASLIVGDEAAWKADGSVS